jgi:hypothetical protein
MPAGLLQRQPQQVLTPGLQQPAGSGSSGVIVQHLMTGWLSHTLCAAQNATFCGQRPGSWWANRACTTTSNTCRCSGFSLACLLGCPVLLQLLLLLLLLVL